MIGTENGAGHSKPRHCLGYFLAFSFDEVNQFLGRGEKENPGQFRDLLQIPGAIRAPHDVADGLDGSV